ncbi:hypothetical protein J2S03_002955 [Alicyclobacillus cycloheptanicus]|uniref:Uncharacterized protein n=1 Tax=Alicyclobacillus cycloheptanicus TaxID=1457 RepID=A0ABT9XLI6_9BACL|nr:hypothetical protein [Alicyclobacillus cycloheptanicus]
MHAYIGDCVKHPDRDEQGEVVDIRTNPACLLRWSSNGNQERRRN